MLIAFVELVEAEGKVLRKATFGLAWRVIIMVLAVVFVGAGLVLLGLALYHYLATTFSINFALASVGILAVTAGGIALWQLHRTLN